MKDNKIYKVLRIIFLTLAIISLVFTLCKKVGLCANVSPSEYVTEFPLPYGVGSNYGYGDFPLTDDIVQGAIDTALDFHPEWGFFTQGYCVLVHEIDTENNIIVFHIRGGNSFGTVSSTSLQDEPSIGTTSGKALLRVKYDNGSFSVPYYVPTEYPSYISLGLQNLPTSGKYLPSGVFLHNYPVAFSDSFNLTYSNQLLFQKYVVPDTGFNSDDYVFSDYNNLPDSPSSGDPDYNLYQWLNGHNESNYDYTKSIFDLIKGFFVWFTQPFDSEAASDSLESIQVISDIRSLNNVIGSAGIFNWSDVSPASRVAFTFDFGGAVLPHHQYEINFDWYTGTVKTLILSILVTFLVVGLLVTIINNIPSMIHGHSGDSGGGSN